MIQFNKSVNQIGAQSDSSSELIELATRRMRQGLAPPAEIYRIEYRNRLDWSEFPSWARQLDPDIFDGCCHEG
jgi:hypothetical protein